MNAGMEPEGNCTVHYFLYVERITTCNGGFKMEKGLMQNLMHQGSAHVFFNVISVILIIFRFYFIPFVCVFLLFSSVLCG